MTDQKMALNLATQHDSMGGSKEHLDSDTKIDIQDALPTLGDFEGRKELEKKLLWKLDLRMSILLVIYILNYVCH